MGLKRPKKSAKELLFGSYDYGYLCTPKWPYCTGGAGRPAPPLFGVDEPLGLLTALIMGLQHTLAMAGGLIVPPILVGSASDDPVVKTYLVSAALIVCSIATFVQVCGFSHRRLPFLQLGSGLLSVMGISFTPVPLFQSAIGIMMSSGLSFNAAYGKLLGTAAVAAVVPLLISLFPFRALRRTFPPVVTGTTIMLIGIHLIGASGIMNWGGGAYCGKNYQFSPTEYEGCSIPLANGTIVQSTCINTASKVLCAGNGSVMLPFGSPSYLGLGLLVFATIILLELFGSPFLRSSSAILALLIGYLVAAVTVNPATGGRYVTTKSIDSAPAITFLWTTTFPLGFYAPALLPMLIIFCITSIETIGDVTATAEASGVSVGDVAHAQRIKGGLLNDCVSSIFSSFAMSMPLTTFAQNNGIISLTNVASRWAGWAAALWLLLLGVLGKFSGWVLSIPNCVFGGLTTFLFANVISSGIKIIISEGGGLSRRSRFILACSLAIGLGVEAAPQWATNALWPADPGMSPGLAGLRESVMLILSTGFTIGTVVAMLLNGVLPTEAPSRSADLTLHAGGAGADKAYAAPGVGGCGDGDGSIGLSSLRARLQGESESEAAAACGAGVKDVDVGAAPGEVSAHRGGAAGGGDAV